MSLFRPTLPPKHGYVEVEHLGKRIYQSTDGREMLLETDVADLVKKYFSEILDNI